MTMTLTLTLTLTLTALQLASVEALPITSRPIEGNAQLLAWQEWQRLTPDQRTLEKDKKVTAKSIFTLPYRHCPPNHKHHGDLCIPQINIDPIDLVKQELLIGLNPVGSGPSIDYDYSDSDGGDDGDEESDELLITVPLMQKGQLLPGSATEDQALPSEDAPLKFNIFENKYPMALDPTFNATATTATTTTTTTTTSSTTTTTEATTPLPLPLPTMATLRQPDNRIAVQLDDLLADSSVALPSSTTLSISMPPSNMDDFGSIEAIVVPAGVPSDEQSSIQLMQADAAAATSTAAAATSTAAAATSNADADEEQQQQEQGEAEEDAEGEQALAQLLKDDTLLLATAYGSSIDLLPPFSHRRVAPLLSADLDEADETAATDMAPTGNATPTTATATATTARTTTTTTSTTTTAAEGELHRVVLEKSKVQPVQLSSTVATTTATATTMATPTTIAAESSATTTTAAAAAAEVEATATATTAVTTTTATVAAAAEAEAEVAAIHQDVKDDDRFYYQHSETTTSSNSNTSNGDAVDLDELNYMASSDNLMTNTIGGQGDGEKVNFEQELSIINELVKGKWRLSQQRQQQQQLLSSSTTTAATSTSVESSSAATSSTAATATATATSSTAATATATATTTETTATTATESTTFWSKLMPTLSQGSTEATTAEQTAETITATTAQQSVVDTSIATATAATTSHLSINTNRSNRNSKIIRIDSIVESSTTTTTTTPAPTATATTAAAAAAISSNRSNNDAAYTPFWWLPNFGVRLDRQVDANGEDRSLLLRFFRPFRAGNTGNTED
ncbi:hypothetical protein KR044_007616, partial [Drosophila immigrans]